MGVVPHRGGPGGCGTVYHAGLWQAAPGHYLGVHFQKTDQWDVKWGGAVSGFKLDYVVVVYVPYLGVRGQWSQRRGGGQCRVTGFVGVG